MHKKVMKLGVVSLVVTGTLLYPCEFEQADTFTKKHYVKAAETDTNTIKLINGDFETPEVTDMRNRYQTFNHNTVPGWKTTASDEMIEFQTNGRYNYVAPSGKQWAELNANQVGALYQDIATTPGTTIRWQVYHRGYLGTDVATVEFGAPGEEFVIQETMSSDDQSWHLYQGSYTIPEGQTVTRFQFKSVSTAKGKMNYGNFLDNVVFASSSNLVLEGQFDQTRIKEKQVSQYQLKVANNGGMTAVDNQLTIQLPSEVSYVAGTLAVNGTSFSNEHYDAATHQLTLTLGDIADGSDAQLTLNVTGNEVTSGAQVTSAISYQDQNFDDTTYQAASNKSTIMIEADEAPVVTGEDLTLKKGEPFNPLAGMTVSDKEDGDLTDRLQVIENTVDVNQPGVYTVKYQVTDSFGNTVTFERKVTIRTDEIPVITGEKETSIKAGQTFDQMSTMQAVDKEDGDITSQLKVTGNIDTTKTGDYTLTYSVTDSDGNVASFERTIHVLSNEKPVISGSAESTTKAGQTFDPLAGIHATDNEDGDLTDTIQVTGSVDTNVAGDYPLTYTVTDSDGNTTTFERIIHVVSNEAPTILCETKTEIKAGTPFNPFTNVTAFDQEDGDLTAKVQVSGSVDVNTPGDYILTYTVTDSDGNTTTFERTVTVISNEKPTITGETTTNIPANTKFDPLDGISATDNEDGDLTAKIQVSGSVDASTPGDYILTYTVTDSDGNTTTFKRTVTVETNEKPTFVIDGPDSIAKGSSFDPFDGVRIIDAEDGDLTDKAVISGTVDTNVPGDYTLTYTVTDSDGNVISFTRTIHVTEQSYIVNPDDKNDPAQGTSVTPADNNSNQAAATNTALPKTGDAPVWPWSVAGGLLLLLGAAGLSRSKAKKN